MIASIVFSVVGGLLTLLCLGLLFTFMSEGSFGLVLLDMFLAMGFCVMCVLLALHAAGLM